MNDVLIDPLAVDPARLDHDERLSLLESIEHQRSALDAQQQLTLSLLADEDVTDTAAKEWVREEIAAVLCLAPATASVKLHEAGELVKRLPHTLDRLVDGSISMMHARAVIDASRFLPDSAVTELEKRVIPRAAGQTIGNFRRLVKRVLMAIDPRDAEQQHAAAVADRAVRMYAGEHGMATVRADLRADLAAGLMTAIDAHARALPDDGRTIDQRRADVLADLGTLALNNAATTWQGQRPAVNVSVALSTLIGVDEQPGELDGYGPIPASMARAIAHDPSGTWRRLVVDPVGHLIDYGRTTYRPPAPLRNHVLNLHKTCTFPGCRRVARHTELDHIIPFDPNGTTSNPNLHNPCKRHHDAKHQAGWTVTKSYDNVVTWTSATGRRYESEPTRHPVDTTVDPPPF